MNCATSRSSTRISGSVLLMTRLDCSASVNVTSQAGTPYTWLPVSRAAVRSVPTNIAWWRLAPVRLDIRVAPHEARLQRVEDQGSDERDRRRGRVDLREHRAHRSYEALQ